MNARSVVQRGWRIDRIPSRPARAVEGRVAVPLWLVRDGEHVADVDLLLSAAEAEVLHAETGDVLAVLRALASRPARDAR